jgi:hypothetical protein
MFSLTETSGELHDSQCREDSKHGHESRGTRNQESLCWRGPAVKRKVKTDTYSERLWGLSCEPTKEATFES